MAECREMQCSLMQVKDREHVGGETVGHCGLAVEELVGGRTLHLDRPLQVSQPRNLDRIVEKPGGQCVKNCSLVTV